MNKRQLLFLCLFIIAAFHGSLAQGQTLEEALTAAYLNNPTLTAERAALRATDEQAPQAISGWRPTVEMVGDAGLSINKNNQAVDTYRQQHRNPRSVGLTISQSIYKGGQTEAAINEAENMIKAGRRRLMAVEQTVLMSAVATFMDVYRDQAVLALNISNEQVLKRQLEAAQDRFNVGEITRTDVSQAQARLARATADRINAEGNLEITRAAYRNVVGMMPGNLEYPKSPKDLPASLNDANNAAAEANPSVAEAEFNEKARRANVDQTQGELLPSIDLLGTAKRAFDSTSEESRVDTYEAKLTLTVPIYQSGAVYSRLREAKQLVGEQRQLIDKARRDAVQSSTQAWESLQTARAQIDSFKTQIKSSEVALEGVQREASVGSRTVLDILDAEQELLDAKVSMVRAERDEVVATFKLKEAIGKLTARHLTLPVDFYDPASHYNEVRDKWFGIGGDINDPANEKTKGGD